MPENSTTGNEARNPALRDVRVNVFGKKVTVELHDAWRTLAAVVTAALWAAGEIPPPLDNLEVRDADGTLLLMYAPLGAWIDGMRLNVNRLAGVGA